MTRRNLLFIGATALSATALMLITWLYLALAQGHERHPPKLVQNTSDEQTYPTPEALMEESWLLADRLWQGKEGREERAAYLANWCLIATDLRSPKAKVRCLLSFNFDALHIDEDYCFYGVKEVQSVVAISYLDPELAMNLLHKVPAVQCKPGEAERYRGETSE